MDTTNTLDPETRRRNDLLTGHVGTLRWAAKWVERRTVGLSRDDAASLLALQALEKWGQYNGKFALTTWIRALCRTVIVLHTGYALADKRTAKRTCRAGEGFQFADQRPTHDDELAEAEERSRDVARALAAVDALPEPFRSVIRLRLGLDGPALTLQEIGDRLGRTRERVRQLEAEAVRRLREAVGAESAETYHPLRRPAPVKPRRELPKGFSRRVTGRIRFIRQRMVDGQVVRVSKTFPDLETAQRWVAENLDGKAVPG